MWAIIRELVGRGTTLLLTTQYLDEADELANTIVVVDRGHVIASGTPDQLKDQVGGDLLEFTVPDRTKLDDALRAVAGLSATSPTVETDAKRIKVPVGSGGSTALVDAVRRLDAAGVATEDLALHRPSLDDVFLAVTGHAAEVEPDGAAKGRKTPAAGVAS
jgi:ABC-2 type transport system ATP-binding protein